MNISKITHMNKSYAVEYDDEKRDDECEDDDFIVFFDAIDSGVQYCS